MTTGDRVRIKGKKSILTLKQKETYAEANYWWVKERKCAILERSLEKIVKTACVAMSRS